MTVGQPCGSILVGNSILLKILVLLLIHEADHSPNRDCGLAEWIIDDSCLVHIRFCYLRTYVPPRTRIDTVNG